MTVKTILRTWIGPFYSAVHTLPNIVSERSYYPELKRKSVFRRYLEVLWLRLRTGATPLFYNAFGLDVSPVVFPEGQYVDERSFWTRMIAQNYPSKINHAIVLRDKLLFWSFMRSHGIRTPEIFAHSKGGHYFVGTKEVSFEEWMLSWRNFPDSFYLKCDTECCGRGVYHVVKSGTGYEINGSSCDLTAMDKGFFEGRDFILQEAVVNHPLLAKVYPYSLNTARYITVWDDKTNRPALFAQFFRIGANGNHVDNWAVGGLLFSLSGKGEIGEFGFYKDEKYAKDCTLRVSKHPETGMTFKGVCLPGHDEALALALKAHSLLPGVKSIGWDLAFTSDGPVVIEGNDDWEIVPCQIFYGGMKELATKYFGEF